MQKSMEGNLGRKDFVSAVKPQCGENSKGGGFSFSPPNSMENQDLAGVYLITYPKDCSFLCFVEEIKQK